MTKLLSTLAALTLATTVSAHAELDHERVCANVIYRYPTPAPLELVVDGNVVITCNQTATDLGTVRFTFFAMSDIAWWQDNTEDRPVTEE